MVWDGFIICPAEFMGTRSSTPLNQMGRACNSHEAMWNHQDDKGFSPWLEVLKGPSTEHQVKFEIYQLNMNYAVIVSWGGITQRYRAVLFLWRISLEPILDPVLPRINLCILFEPPCSELLSVASSGKAQIMCSLAALRLEHPPLAT
jgi:hypothetical protein